MIIKGREDFKIYKISNSGMAWGEQVDGSAEGVCLGPIDCSEGDTVEAILIQGKQQSPYTCGICTDTSLWTKTTPNSPKGGMNRKLNPGNYEKIKDYPERMINQFSHTNRSKIKDLLYGIQSEGPLRPPHLINRNEDNNRSDGDENDNMTENIKKEHPEINDTLDNETDSVAEPDPNDRNIQSIEQYTSGDEPVKTSENKKERTLSNESDTTDGPTNKQGEQTDPPIESEFEADSTKINEQIETTLSEKERQELRQIREQAEQAANKNPTQINSSSGGSQYQRSKAIRDYALIRANGICESCKEPAPFETAEGKPYLEVHHVDELGSGGADSPNKVIALCPTCHRRVHHAKHGEEFNQQLREKLESGLANQGT